MACMQEVLSSNPFTVKPNLTFLGTSFLSFDYLLGIYMFFYYTYGILYSLIFLLFQRCLSCGFALAIDIILPSLAEDVKGMTVAYSIHGMVSPALVVKQIPMCYIHMVHVVQIHDSNFSHYV